MGQPFDTRQLPGGPDVVAPDGSDVRVLLQLAGGGMAHFELAARGVSRAVAHHSVDEIWYILRGHGQMWRRQAGREETVALRPGTCVSIPAGTYFQFRSTSGGPLAAVGVTMPPWPGEHEAYEVHGPWPADTTAGPGPWHGREAWADTWRVDPQIVRYSERPELWEATDDLFADIWPEYNRHGRTLNHYWGQLSEVFPEWQFLLCDPGTGDVLAEGHTIPVAWDGSDAGLGPGIDATIAAGFRLHAAGGEPTCLCALAAEIPARYRGRHLSGVILRAMAGLAREAGLSQLIAPVRPSLKERYPTIPLERYARWTRPDGSPFDPWIRVHTLLGARIGPVIPRSLHITGTVEEWESWTKMRFPETGDYVFPAGLATVHIDRERDLGEYWEPNIWVIHTPGR